jgi:hypothetical protein
MDMTFLCQFGDIDRATPRVNPRASYPNRAQKFATPRGIASATDSPAKLIAAAIESFWRDSRRSFLNRIWRRQ